MDASDTHDFAQLLGRTAIDKLATDVVLVDLRSVVSYTDWFVICTAQNARMARAISEHVVGAMKDGGWSRPRQRDADADGSWLVLDYNDVVMHVFTPEARTFYRLENLWGQVPQEELVDDAAERRLV